MAAVGGVSGSYGQSTAHGRTSTRAPYYNPTKGSIRTAQTRYQDPNLSRSIYGYSPATLAAEAGKDRDLMAGRMGAARQGIFDDMRPYSSDILPNELRARFAGLEEADVASANRARGDILARSEEFSATRARNVFSDLVNAKAMFAAGNTVTKTRDRASGWDIAASVGV